MCLKHYDTPFRVTHALRLPCPVSSRTGVVRSVYFGFGWIEPKLFDFRVHNLSGEQEHLKSPRQKQGWERRVKEGGVKKRDCKETSLSVKENKLQTMYILYVVQNFTYQLSSL